METAHRVGMLLAARGLGLVYGGGGIGLMGAVADGALAAGGNVIGIIPASLAQREVAHVGLHDLRIVASMHERKAQMADLADGFLALPGGIGTFEEFFEILTWAQLRLHTKPCALLNISGYYDPVLTLLDHAVSERFLRAEHRRIVLTDTDPEGLLDAMAVYQPPNVEKWLQRVEP